MRTHSLLAGLLLALSSSASWAAQPLFTDDTGTQGEGGNQIEFSFDRDRAEQAGLTNTTRTLPFTFTRGITDALDVFASVNHTRLTSSLPGTDASGSGNPSLGLKWRFHENEASKTSFGIKPEVILPVSASNEAAGLGSGRTSYALTAILSQETSFGSVHANLAASRARFRDPAANPDASVIHVSIAPIWDLNEQWKLVADIGAETERAAGNRTRAFLFEIGAIYSPSKDLDFAFGFIRRNDRTTPGTTSNAITAGITWRFK